MAITAAMVKELRERTGSGMMDCKKALTETDGDMEAAIDLMRASGAAKAAKKAGRVAAEGLVKFKMSDDSNNASIIEVNSETDFVSKSDDFVNFVNELTDLALDSKAADIDALNTQQLGGISIDEARQNLIGKIGENVSVRRTAFVSGDNLAGYQHGERIGVLVALNGGDSALAKDIAMHIAASKPECVSEAELSQDLIDREKAVFTEQARESGKPDEIIEKMIVGRMKKFVNEVCLIGQPFVKDPDTTVGKLLKDNNAEVVSFVRYEVGEGIEKAEDNFVEEVMAQAKGG
jgi:elongation factor Ts